MTTYSDRHYGDGVEGCPNCGGIGYIRYDVPEDHPYFGRMFHCKCQWPKRAANWRRLSGMTEAEVNYRFDNLIPQENTLREAIEAARALAAPGGPYMLTLLGLYGTAKSHLGFAIVNEVLERGYSAVAVNAEIMLNHIRDGYKNEDDRAIARLNTFTEEVGVLVVDDTGRINPTTWGIQYMFQILDRRYRLALARTHKTVVCANAEVDGRGRPIFEWDDGAIASRLSQFPIIKIEQADARPALAGGAYREEED